MFTTDELFGIVLPWAALLIYIVIEERKIKRANKRNAGEK